jgi:hypothetical protein
LFLLILVNVNIIHKKTPGFLREIVISRTHLPQILRNAHSPARFLFPLNGWPRGFEMAISWE